MSTPRTATRRQRRLAERVARRDTPRRPQAPRGLSLGSLSALVIIGGLAVVVLAIVLGARPTPAAAERATVTITHAPTGLTMDGFVLGRPDAPVTIDLYEDFQCPACAAWGRSVFQSLASNELAAGTVRIVFHDMAFLGPESVAAGRAAYAARQQGRFWDMWATLYANQGRESSGAFSRDRLIAMADGLGLDVTRFDSDMASRAADSAIAGSRAEAGRAGISSTPTLIIDGRAYVGVQPYSDIAAVIAAAAAR